ncbi:hemerythrin domain-containing protein [Microvirga solisilvae]|uniref:hemerythrin domain-containing protein n=1 Tax=Microvirga solisilvae TaxID=2919498 RepID=UPI001FB03C9D|nr:hemerythrin domain-containing protein [Microvirga solisilvae]
MDLWRMILSEHANIEELCREVLEATGTGPNSRAELFADLEDELDRHIAAKQNVLYPALARDGRTETYLHELDDEHNDIRRRIGRLSTQPNKNTREWALDFKELVGVIRHAFSLEENGALVAAHGIISAREANELRRAYEREKIASYEASRWHMPQAMMPSRYGMPTGMTFAILAGAFAIGGAALAWSMSQGGQSRSNRPLRPAPRRPQPPFPLDSGVVDRSLSRRGMEGRASTGSPRSMPRDTRAGSEENWFSSANPPRAPSSLSTPLQPGGTVPGTSPASSVGSMGTGGGQTENRDTGAMKKEGP